MAETSIQWSRGTKSYFAMDYRNKVDERICSPHYGFWVEAPSGEKLYEPLTGLLFLRTLCTIMSAPYLYNVHFMKQDDERLTSKNSYNAPHRSKDGKWSKDVTPDEQLKLLAGYGLLALSIIQNHGNRTERTLPKPKRHVSK